ncbi:MAG: F0F1 ATP synthase subunit A [Coriobacteriales bacterium]|jgi:F-type H+-transporting ATPase subunit a|nr:F0F1 ATP synthase subunit A [Coriobacteriales bacterium]
MNPFDELQAKVEHLISNVVSGPFIGPLTTYTPYILFILLLVVVIIFIAKRQLSLVPKNRFVGVVEFFVDFAQNNTAYGVMGPAAKKHVPFLLTLFIFILVSNLIGIIPGSRAATGTIGSTLPLAAISFVYFTVYGIKERGGLHYLKSFAPSGLKPAPLAAFIWFLEFFSMILRLLTLSVRLFANMLAGHLLLGTLAIMAYLFIQPIITAGISAASIGFSLASLLWMVLLVVMYALEVFVACVQAYIFTLLSSVYVYLATEEH